MRICSLCHFCIFDLDGALIKPFVLFFNSVKDERTIQHDFDSILLQLILDHLSVWFCEPDKFD